MLSLDTTNTTYEPRCKESGIISGRTEDFNKWFSLQKATPILQPKDLVGYAASFMEVSTRQLALYITDYESHLFT